MFKESREKYIYIYIYIYIHRERERERERGERERLIKIISKTKRVLQSDSGLTAQNVI